MTPFMLRVAEAVEGEPDGGADGTPARPRLRDTAPKPVPIGADEQVALRALAEQLVAEANAVLADAAAGAAPERIELDDHLVEGQLGFSLRYRARGAVLRTRFGDHAAYGELLGLGGACSRQVELADAGELQNLILLLLTGQPAGQPI